MEIQGNQGNLANSSCADTFNIKSDIKKNKSYHNLRTKCHEFETKTNWSPIKFETAQKLKFLGRQIQNSRIFQDFPGYGHHVQDMLNNQHIAKLK